MAKEDESEISSSPRISMNIPWLEPRFRERDSEKGRGRQKFEQRDKLKLESTHPRSHLVRSEDLESSEVVEGIVSVVTLNRRTNQSSYLGAKRQTNDSPKDTR